MNKESKLKDFLQNSVSPIFERLIVDMLIDNPEDVVMRKKNALAKDKVLRRDCFFA